MQLECNCRKLHRRICNWKNTGKLKQTAYMSLCGWGQWLVMWAFCMTWRCWFCLVPHEEYLSLVCEQKATKQVEFIRYSDRLVALYPQSPLKLWGFYMAGGAGFQPSTVLRQTCSIVLTSNSAVVEQNHFHKDYNCVCFSSYIFFCAVSCSCIPVANSSCKFYFHWGKHSQARQSLKPDI